MIRLNPVNGQIETVVLPEEVRSGTTGMMGLTPRPNGYLAMLQPNTLVYLSPNLEVESYLRLPMVRDGHSVAWREGAAYLISSGTDQVLRVAEDGSADVFWEASSTGTDTVHMNCLIWHQGQCLISAFGGKKAELWRSADDGYVYNISNGQYLLNNIYHPHSVLIVDDDLWLCESSRIAVVSRSGVRVETPWGYLRGLCRVGSTLYVGSTFGRNKSKSEGVLIDNQADPGVRSGVCGVGLIELDGPCSRVKDFIDLTDYAEEIYDIIELQ